MRKYKCCACQSEFEVGYSAYSKLTCRCPICREQLVIDKQTGKVRKLHNYMNQITKGAWPSASKYREGVVAFK